MKVSILFASPRPDGNTAQLLTPVKEHLKKQGHEINEFSLYREDIRPCIACRHCQKDWTVFGCIHDDSMQKIFDTIMSSDLLILASPVYSWSWTAPMKAALDRLVYGMNKYYGEQWGPSLWEGKRVALVTTCGYAVEKGTDLLEESLRRYCRHSKLEYMGMLAARQRSYKEAFMDEEKWQRAVQFAEKIGNVFNEGCV